MGLIISFGDRLIRSSTYIQTTFLYVSSIIYVKFGARLIFNAEITTILLLRPNDIEFFFYFIFKSNLNFDHLIIYCSYFITISCWWWYITYVVIVNKCHCGTYITQLDMYSVTTRSIVITNSCKTFRGNNLPLYIEILQILKLYQNILRHVIGIILIYLISY